MTREDLIKSAEYFVNNSDYNYITNENAISEDVVGLKIYDAPIFGFGAADDEQFTLFKESSIIGEHFTLPNQWLPKAKTVISFFLPFTEAVKKGNRKDKSWPSEEWLHGRIEGQNLLNKLCVHLNSQLINSGYNSIIPAQDERFWKSEAIFTSNWSERHVTYVCGLGTFGLSKGLITKKGIAGRFGSIITDLYLTPDEREYKNIYEYCTMCGKCAINCPVNAISIEEGKNHEKCNEFINITIEKYKPRYGCGKCQVAVPCESSIPKRCN